MNQLILNRNEIIAGPAPACLWAIEKFKPDHVSRYLESYYNSVLVPQLSQSFGVPEKHIMLGYGSEHLLSLVFNFADGGSVLTHTHHYIFYDKYIQERNISLHTFNIVEQDKEFVFDIKDCIKQYKKFRPKVLLITSPNNPTGNSISFADIKKILEVVSKKCLVVVDEAYWGLDNNMKKRIFCLW